MFFDENGIGAQCLHLVACDDAAAVEEVDAVCQVQAISMFCSTRTRLIPLSLMIRSRMVESSLTTDG